MHGHVLRLRRRSSRPGSRGGFSLIEVVIAALILVSAVMVAMGVLGSMSEHVAESTAALDARTQAHQAKVFLRGAMRGLVVVPTPSPPLFTAPSPFRSALHPTTNQFTGLQYVTATGYDTSTNRITISPTCTLSFVLDAGETLNGVDDDGDGFVDEGTLRWSRGGVSRVVALGVDGSSIAVRYLPAFGAPSETTASPLQTDVELMLTFTVQARGRRPGVVERASETIRVGFRNSD